MADYYVEVIDESSSSVVRSFYLVGKTENEIIYKTKEKMIALPGRYKLKLYLLLSASYSIDVH